jgi:SAM-dependent methyltransferase
MRCTAAIRTMCGMVVLATLVLVMLYQREQTYLVTRSESKLSIGAMLPSVTLGAMDSGNSTQPTVTYGSWKQLWLSKGFNKRTEKPLHVIDGFDDLSEAEYNDVIFGALQLLDVDLSLVTNILELGSGAGAFARALLLRWPHLKITGIDFSPTMVSISNERVNGTFLVHDLSDPLPFRDLSFDFVVMWSTLFYLKTSAISSLLWEVKRVSRLGIFIGDVSDGRKRSVAERMRNETHAHLKNPFLSHTYLKPRFFLQWAEKASWWARFSDEDSLAVKYEQAKYRFSVALGPLPLDLASTFWEVDPHSIGTVCSQPPFAIQHFKLSPRLSCTFRQSFYEVSLEKVGALFQVRISGWRQGCLSSGGTVTLKLHSTPPIEIDSKELERHESAGYILPNDVSYATIHCLLQVGRDIERQGLVVNTAFFIQRLPSVKPAASNRSRSVFHLQLDAVSRVRLQLELPKLFSFLTSLNMLGGTRAVDFPAMTINGQNTVPNFLSSLCNDDCESQSVFDLARQNGYRTMYFNNYCPMYPFPWKGGDGPHRPDIILLPEINCLEGDAGNVEACRSMEDTPATSALAALFDVVIHSVETGPIFAFGTLNDGHSEDTSKLIRMEDLIIKKIKDLVSSSWFKRGGIFILGSDHGLHYWRGVSIDLNPATPYAFLDTPLVSSHRNPPFWLVFDADTGLEVDERNVEAVITHYDSYHTVLSSITGSSHSSQNLFSDNSFENRACTTVHSSSRYCNCWRQCIHSSDTTTNETSFSARLQHLKQCVV